jgi:hypothetical protein
VTVQCSPPSLISAEQRKRQNSISTTKQRGEIIKRERRIFFVASIAIIVKLNTMRVSILFLTLLPPLLLLLSASSSLALQCVDEDGSEVDWLVIYKLPREAGRKQQTDGFVGQGKVS